MSTLRDNRALVEVCVRTAHVTQFVRHALGAAMGGNVEVGGIEFGVFDGIDDFLVVTG